MASLQLKEDVTGRLIASFTDLIAKGSLKPGERLPPERDLAKQFGASRASLRQAMKVLENVGVISQRVGDGSYLNTDASRIFRLPLTFLVLLDDISLFELFDARLMLEPELAARAAESASPAHLGAMRETLVAMERGQHVVEADIAFHATICKATGNRVCERMFAAIYEAFKRGMELTTQLSPPTHTLRFHSAVYGAIHLRQPDEARKRMAEHLNDARALLWKACLERESPGGFTAEPET